MKRKAQSDFKLTPAQILLGIHLRELGYLPEYEVHIPPSSQCRFDVQAGNMLFEISGGNWSGGHRRGEAQETEYTKLNWAQMFGFKTFQFTNRQVMRGEAKKFLERWVAEPVR